MRAVGSTSRPAFWAVRWLGRWLLRHRRWVVGWLVAALAAWLLGATRSSLGLVALALGPGVAGCLWDGLAPGSYEALMAGPARRFGWRRRVRKHWTGICRDAHLADRRIVTRQRFNGERVQVERWRCPRLAKIRTSGHSIRLVVRARSGQTLDEVTAGAERIASTFDAAALRTWPVSGSRLVIELVMRDLLTEPMTATEPDQAGVVDMARLGRTQAGREWWLALTGRHTLCVGASGSGKGSVLWGVCCGLAPAVRQDAVRLWGVDLKRGVELSMGASLFTTLATTPDQSVQALRHLVDVIGTRGEVMAGATRQHTPRPGDPMHVLVIDELAALTAYAPTETRREGERLLATILTQGRALGVIVVAFVQDPRKEVVGMRGLFTQTVALRLRSSEETAMVLGDGMARLAPAHRISPNHPGTGWIVDDSGAADRVRADYWPDDLIRDLSRRYATRERITLTRPEGSDGDGQEDQPGSTVAEQAVRKPRTPRKPRAPRQPRQPRVRDCEDGAA